MYDPPEPQPPRVYRLASDAPVEEPHGSVALAVLGEMLNETEWDLDSPDLVRTDAVYLGMRVSVLRETRDRIAKAEHDAR